MASNNPTENLTFTVRIEAQGAPQAAAAVQQFSQTVQSQAVQTATAVKQIARQFDDLMLSAHALISLGRSARIFGEMFGSEDLKKIGEYTAGLGELVLGIARLKNVIGELSALQATGLIGKIAGALGAASGTSLLGALGTIAVPVVGAATGVYAANDIAKTNQAQQILERFRDQIANLPAGQKADEVAKLNKYLQDNSLGSFTDRVIAFGQAVALASSQLNALLSKPIVPFAPGSLIYSAMQAKNEPYNAIENLRGTRGYNAGVVDEYSAFRDAADKKRAEQIANSMKSIYSTIEKDTRDYGKRLVDLEKSIGQERLKAAKQYSDEVAKLEADYAKNRADIISQYNTNEERAVQDHARQMAQMTQDHNKNLRKLADARDALGIEDENDRYRTEQKRADEQYNTDAQRRREDYQKQLYDLQINFNNQRQTTYDAYQQQLADISQHYANQRTLINEWFDAIQADINQRIADAYANARTSTNGTPQQPDPFHPTHAAGGYTQQGFAYLHAGEYVLNADTTRKAEAMMGGSLTQGGILGSMGNASISQSFMFGGVTNHQEIMGIVKQATREGLLAVAKGLQTQTGARV